MAFSFSQRSIDRLQGLHPDLVKVAEAAIGLSEVDFFIVEGLRSREQMAINWGKGRTSAQCSAAGVDPKYAQPSLPKVTWLREPYSSNHGVKDDGFGHAVDVGALHDGVYDGNTASLYDRISHAFFAAAHLSNVKLRWGGDWDGDGRPHEAGETDMAHFEIIT